MNINLVQNILRKQGFLPSFKDGVLDNRTKNALIYFQQTHIGPDGSFLDVTGEIDQPTLWALNNPSGNIQRSFISTSIPENISSNRKDLLEIALHEHEIGTREDPDGSNTGDGVIKFVGTIPRAWCCLFWSWCNKQAFNYYPLGSKYSLCYNAYKKALKLNYFKDLNYDPLPGDTFLMLYKKNNSFTGKGHIGIVLRTHKDPTGKVISFDTVEGNCGNRVKVGNRKITQSTLVGFMSYLA